MESLIVFLPYALLLLICPVMMALMMRGGHGHHNDRHVEIHRDDSADRVASAPTELP